MKHLILFVCAVLCLSCYGQGLLNRLQKTVEAVDAAKNVLAPAAQDAAFPDPAKKAEAERARQTEMQERLWKEQAERDATFHAEQEKKRQVEKEKLEQQQAQWAKEEQEKRLAWEQQEAARKKKLEEELAQSTREAEERQLTAEQERRQKTDEEQKAQAAEKERQAEAARQQQEGDERSAAQLTEQESPQPETVGEGESPDASSDLSNQQTENAPATKNRRQPTAWQKALGYSLGIPLLIALPVAIFFGVRISEKTPIIIFRDKIDVTVTFFSVIGCALTCHFYFENTEVEPWIIVTALMSFIASLAVTVGYSVAANLSGASLGKALLFSVVSIFVKLAAAIATLLSVATIVFGIVKLTQGKQNMGKRRQGEKKGDARTRQKEAIRDARAGHTLLLSGTALFGRMVLSISKMIKPNNPA